MAGLSLSLLLVVALLAWAVFEDGPYVAPRPKESPALAAPTLAAEALHQLEEAVSTGDVAAAQRLAPAGDDRARSLLATIVDNAEALRVGDFTLRYVDELGAISSEGEWEAAVDTTWAFGGFDRAPARAEVQFGFRSIGDQVFLTSVGGGDRRSPVWMAGPVQVRRTPQTLVLVGGGVADAEAYDRRARAAVPVVQGVLQDWRARLVVEVPPSLAALREALDAEPGDYDKIAAVTATADGSLAPDAPVHVFVNPQVFGGLKPRGAQVVMSHEAVHIATDAATSTMPLWLLEGFADHVALRDVKLPLSVTAGQIIRQVRRDGAPRALPGSAEFDTSNRRLGASYESAWLACRLLVDLGGEPALVRFYDRVDAGTGTNKGLVAGFGLTERMFTREWRRLLTDLAT